MKNKLTTAACIGVLLGEGHICEICPNTGKKSKYNVYTGLKITYAGYITPKQFDELISAGLIESTHVHITNKYGIIYKFYRLSPNESED